MEALLIAEEALRTKIRFQTIEIELERGNSIYSTVLYAEHAGVKINIIDCPVLTIYRRSSYILASGRYCINGVNAQSGVDVGAEIQWRWVKSK